MPPPETRTVISASRRSDIPAFYMAWFMEQLARGVLRQVNPYSGRVKLWPATPDRVHSIVFWSKNYRPFLDGGFGERLAAMGYGLLFHFTLNTPHPLLEPRVPPLAERLIQLRTLAQRFGPQTVTWRFDPICFFRAGQGPLEDNLEAFGEIARAASRCGITRCVTSFMDHYRKISRRLAALEGLRFVDPPLERKRELAGRLTRQAGSLGIALELCCERELLPGPPERPLHGAACVSGARLLALYGGAVTRAADSGQRRQQGCGCSRSVDIGDYRLHPCHHDCLFCYASPARDRVKGGGAAAAA
jgi:hypothetical protein